MALFNTLNDEFESHSAQPQNATVYVPAHYDIRSFNGSDLTVPRTMPDFRYWNATSFNGTSMVTLSTPRSVVGRSIAAHTMAEVDVQNQNKLDVQTIADIELYTLASGDEGWPIDPNVVFGKDATLRYANSIAITLVSGVQKTVSSTFRDNLLTDFPNDGSTYYIELALPAFPAQAAGTHLDIANSFIDFSSDPGFAVGSTDSFRFNQSLNSLTTGGNTFFRIDRASLVNTDWSNLQGVRFRLTSVGAMTFKAQSLRLYKAGDFTFPTTAIDTKRNTLRRSVPEASSAATEPTTGQGLILFSGTRPGDVTEIVKFNSGHNPVGNDNYFALYVRYDPTTTNTIKVELNSRSTQSTLTISEKTNGTSFTQRYISPATTNVLTAETDYFLITELKANQIRASIYQSRGAFFGPLVYTTDWRTVTRLGRGLVGYDFNPYNYDFTLDYIKARTASFGAMESSAFSSISPIRGATIYPISSPPEDLSQQNYISSGDTTIMQDPNFGDPAPSYRFNRTGASFFGGWETQNFTFIGDPKHLTITGKIYPSVAGRNFRLLLIDKYDTVAWIAYIPGLRAGQWNEFSIPVNASIAPANYRFALQEVGFYNDTFWVQDLELNHDTVAWKASANAGGAWYNFYNAVGNPYQSVNFNPVSYSQIVLDSSPVAYYRLGDSTSVALDEIAQVNGVIGVNVLTGRLGAITDSTNRAMSFPGNSGGVVTIGDAPKFSFANNQFAFEFWMQASDITSTIGILGKGGAANYEYGIYASTPGTLTFNTWTAAGVAVYPQLTWAYDTNWHHVVFQADGSRAYLFVDSDLVNSVAKSANSMADTTSNLAIGSGTSTTPTTYYMKGVLDEVAFYNKALTDDVINSHYVVAGEPKSMTAIKVRAEALSDTAWIEGYRIYPTYGQFGHLSSSVQIIVPPGVISSTSAGTLDLRIFGQLIATPVTKDLRVTGLGAQTPTTRDIRLAGQLTSNTTKDLRVTATAPVVQTIDLRLIAFSTSSTLLNIMVTGTSTGTFGTTTIGGTWQVQGADYTSGNAFQAPADAASIVKISAYMKGGASSQATRMVIFNASNAGPVVGSSTFVAASPEVVIAAGQAAGWVDYTFTSAVPITANAYYYFGLWNGPTTNMASMAMNGGATGAIGGTNFWDNFPYSSTANPTSPYPNAGGSTANIGWSMYATYNIATGGGGGGGGTTFGFYKWDAKSATVRTDQSFANYYRNHMFNPGTPQAAFGAEAAIQFVPTNQAMVNVTWNPGWTASQVVQIPIPAGTKQGGANDGHLIIARADGTTWEMELFNPTSYTATGIGIVQPGKANEGSYNATAANNIGPYDSVNHYSGSNAANLDMSYGITYLDVINKNYKTLTLGTVVNAVSTSNTSVYPSPPQIYNDPLIPYGVWFRFDPNGTVPNYTNPLEAYIDTCMRLYGGINRDQASGLTVYGIDAINQGGNVTKWASAGVTLSLAGTQGYNIGCYLPNLPWSQLQALQPPPQPY